MALGLCRQSELDAAVQQANAKRLRDGSAMSDDERRKLVSTEQSLGMSPEPKMPSSMSGLESFSLSESNAAEEEEEKEDKRDVKDADSFFNLPGKGDDEDEEDN